MASVINVVKGLFGGVQLVKVSREQAAENRQRVVEAASRLFRETGFEGVGVAEISRAAGLTHGGFYRQFDSKEALFAEAAELALRDNAADLAKAFARPDAIGRYAKGYLSEGHVGAKGGCPVATLGADVSRQPPEVQAAYARGLKAFLAAGRDVKVGSTAWRDSTAGLASIIGTLLMARAVKDADPELSAAIVAAGLDAIADD